jgi:hypothetical protein
MSVPDGQLWSAAAPAEPAPTVERSPVERRRIERRKAALNEELQLRDAKLAYLRKDLALQTDAARRFQLEQQIADERRAIETVEQELEQL